MSVAGRSPASRAVGSVMASPLVARARMLSNVPGLARSRDPTAKALARALRTTALGQIRPDERDWLARIEVRRRELAAEKTAVPAGFEGSGPAPDWVAAVNRATPIWWIFRMHSVAPGWGLFQMRLVRELAPRSCLELGTGLGVSTAYQAASLELNGAGTMVTLEGAQAWGAVAEEGLSALGLAQRVEVRLGPINDTFADVVEQIAPIDYAFLDAEHTEAATLEHFDMVLPHVAGGGVILLDDVTSSPGMKRAWRAIGTRYRVSRRVALGRMGVVVIG